MGFADVPLIVGLVVGSAERGQAVVTEIVRGKELSQRGDELQVAFREVALPGEDAVVRAGHGRGIVGAPAVGRSVAYEIERRGDRLIGDEGQADLRLLRIVITGNCSRDTCLQIDTLSGLATHLVENHLVDVLLVCAPFIGLSGFGHERAGIGKVGTGLGQFQGVGNAVARAAIVARGPIQRQGIAGVADFVQRVSALHGRECERIKSLVVLLIVLIGTGSGGHEQREDRDQSD